MENYIILSILAYLLGSIPTAVIISKKFFGIDIRDYGSGNAGATNTFRVLGKKWGSIVMLIDVLKGYVATSLSYLATNIEANSFQQINLMLVLGLCAVIGHIFPIFANFKGGKGVATLLGMVIAINPLAALVCMGIFLCSLIITKFVSVSSMLAGIAFAILIICIFKVESFWYKGFAIAVAVMLVFTHKKNIIRLINGTENKVFLIKKKKKEKKDDTI